MNKLYDFVLSWKIVQEECIIKSLIITQMNEGDKNRPHSFISVFILTKFIINLKMQSIKFSVPLQENQKANCYDHHCKPVIRLGIQIPHGG